MNRLGGRRLYPLVFKTDVGYRLSKIELLKSEDVSSREVVSSRFKIVEYCHPQTEILTIEDVSSREVESY